VGANPYRSDPMAAIVANPYGFDPVTCYASTHWKRTCNR
jgi:hypothetical protein